MELPESAKKIYYRAFQDVFNVGARCLRWRKPILRTGAGAVSAIPALLAEAGVSRVLLVTGPHLAKSLAPRILEALRASGAVCTVFSDVEANPSADTAEKIRALYEREGCQGFIALGGGSPMDAAKAAAARVARPDRTLAQMAGLLKVRRTLPPFIAVPTTAGTGSETTIAAVVTDRATHHKYAVMDLCLVPRWAVLDPELTEGMSPATTAATGMDALTHAVEAYLCRTYNTRESLRDAEEAVRGVFAHLERAYRDGHDLAAREGMMLAAFQAGFAFTRAGVGNVHAIAHTLGGLYDTPHGLANAVILPIVLEDYGPAVYRKLARLADIAGIPGTGSEEARARAFIAEIRAMNARMGIPAGFAFIRDEDIPKMTAWALAEANPVYPVPVIYDEARCRRVIGRIRAEA